MPDDQLLDRIVLDPQVMLGKPVIKGTRLSVEFILGLLAHGASEQEILQEYYHLSSEDIHACLLFASRTVADSSYMPLTLSA